MAKFIFILSVAFWFHSAHAAKDHQKELFQKVHQLILNNERPKALSLLQQGLVLEAKAAEQQLLRKKISSLSRVFINEKAQQAFEMSIAMRFQDLQQSWSQIQLALKMEPDNLNILLETIRLLILKKDCKSAQESLLKIEKNLGFDEEVQLTRGQVNLCLSDAEGLVRLHLPTDLKKSELSIFWQLLQIENFFKANNKSKSLEILNGVSSYNQELHPDFLYWQWRLGAEPESIKKQKALKYLNMCKDISSKKARELLHDPHVCTYKEIVQQELKTQGLTNEM